MHPQVLSRCNITITLVLSVTMCYVHVDKSTAIIKMCMSSRTKRGTLSITENILQSLKDGEELKTHIAYKSKIDSRTIEKYLPLLVELHLVERAPSDRYRITKKGLQYLTKYDELKEYGVIDDSTR